MSFQQQEFNKPAPTATKPSVSIADLDESEFKSGNDKKYVIAHGEGWKLEISSRTNADTDKITSVIATAYDKYGRQCWSKRFSVAEMKNLNGEHIVTELALRELSKFLLSLSHAMHTVRVTDNNVEFVFVHGIPEQVEWAPRTIVRFPRPAEQPTPIPVPVTIVQG